MNLSTIVEDIHRLNHELERFERKYGVMSHTFYESYISGEEPENEAWVLDFGKWAGLYEIWRDRQQTYDEQLKDIQRTQPSISKVIQVVQV